MRNVYSITTTVVVIDTAMSRRLASRDFPPHLIRRLILPQPDVDRVPQEAITSPGQIRDFGDKLRLDPMDAG
jgi:hypothetical protein